MTAKDKEWGVAPIGIQLRAFTLALGAALGCWSMIPQPARAGDPVLGQKVFQKCRVCHSVEEGNIRGGPTLHGIFGRKAATGPSPGGGPWYSPAFKRLDIVWDEASLRKYLRDPRGEVPGSFKAFVGLKREDELDDVIAYLKEATKPK